METQLEIVINKQSQKYLRKVDESTFRKIMNALDKLRRCELGLDIKRLEGYNKVPTYRLKIEHYRIIFEREKNSIIIKVVNINSRTNIKY